MNPFTEAASFLNRAPDSFTVSSIRIRLCKEICGFWIRIAGASVEWRETA